MRTKKFIVLLFVLFLGMAPIPLILSKIKIRKTECKNQYGDCSVSITEDLRQVEGESLFLAHKRVSFLLKNNIVISEYSSHFNLPDKLLINVVERIPRFALELQDRKVFALIDKSGFIISFADTTNLPKVKIDAELTERGMRIDDKELNALKIVDALSKDYELGNAYITDEKLVIEFERNFDVIFPIEGDRDLLLGSLVLILGEVNKTDSKFDLSGRIIDLRFKNPVIHQKS